MKILNVLADLKGEVSGALSEIPRGSFDLQTALNFAYGLFGLVAVGFIIASGIQYVTSAGDPGKAKKATQSLVFAIVGFVIVLLAAAITNVLFGVLGGD